MKIFPTFSGHKQSRFGNVPEAARKKAGFCNPL